MNHVNVCIVYSPEGVESLDTHETGTGLERIDLAATLTADPPKPGTININIKTVQLAQLMSGLKLDWECDKCKQSR